MAPEKLNPIAGADKYMNHFSGVLINKNLISKYSVMLMLIIKRLMFLFFKMSQPFTSGGQSIGVSVSTSVLPMNTQD